MFRFIHPAFLTRLRKLSHRLGQSTALSLRGRHARRKLSTRLQLERLEDRAVPTITLSPANLPSDTINIPYSQAFGGSPAAITATGGTGAVQLVVSNVQNAIPGLVIPSNATGSLPLGGTPTATGTETFMLTATDTLNNMAVGFYSITVNPNVTLTSTTQTVVAASYFENAVYAFDSGSGALLQTLVPPSSGTVLSMPAGITTGPDNNVYISSQANNAILEYNLTSQQLTTFIPATVLTPIATAANGSKAVFDPAGLVFGPDGNLYVALNGGTRASSGGEVIRFNVANQNGLLTYGGTFTTVATGLIQPTEMTFGTDFGDTDNLYVSNSAAGNVVKVTGAAGASPSSSTFVSAGSGGLTYPSGLAWGSDGNLYVTDLGAINGQGQEIVYSPSGSFLSVFAHPASSLLDQYPSDAVFLNNGNLLTANLGTSFSPNTSGSITEFNPDGSFDQVLTSSAFPPSATGVTHISPTQVTLVNTPPSGSTVVLQPGEINGSYSQLITGGSGTGSVTLSVTNVQNAIAGLSLLGSGGSTISVGGSPTATGTETFTVTATDAVGAMTSINYSVTIIPALTTATHFAVTAPAFVTAGSPLQMTVTALDELNDTIAGYTGTVHFTSSDNQAVLPANTTLVNGTGIFSATLTTAGTQTLTATDTVTTSIAGGSINITVSPAAADRYAITAPSTAKLGTSFLFTVTAQDQFYNTATNYFGAVRFTSSDPNAGVPASTNLTNGTGIFVATLNTEGNQTITAYDTVSNLITGRSSPIAAMGAASKFVVSGPTAAGAGTVFVFTVMAEDSKSNVATSYTGIVHITSTDGQAILPANATLTNGIGFFAAMLRTAGTQTITATDTVTTTIKGTSAKVTVTAAAASHFGISAPVSATTGSPLTFTVTALDSFNNVAVSYSGTVAFSSTDTAISVGSGLPSSYTFTTSGGSPDLGIHVFSATLLTAGNQTISAADSANSIAGASNVMAARGLVVSSLTPTSTGFVATFSKPFDPTQINLYDAASTYGPDDVLLTGPGSPQISFHGSLIIGPGNTITFVKTSLVTSPNFNPATGVLSPGTYTVTLRSASNGFKDILGTPLDGANTGNPAGSNYVATFVVTAAAPVVVGVPSFARGPDGVDAINVPAGATNGIPVNLSVGTGVTSGKFTLQYNSALLSVTGATVNSALTGASLSLDSASTAGTAVIDFSSSTPLATSTAAIRLGGLVATVPNSTVPLYKSKALLHWSAVQLGGSGGSITVEGDDAVEVVAYLGDTNGDGTLSGGDGANISQLNSFNNSITGTLGGFAAYPLADPTIIGDLNNNGNSDSADVTLLNSYLSGTPHTQIPTPPPALAGFTVTGPDPALSVPNTLKAPLGGTVVVPVNIDTAHPFGSTGATEAILALEYNPLVFSVSAQDVQFGSLTANGWQLTAVVNAQTGKIGIDLFSSNPVETTAGGSLALISLHVRETAPVGSAELTLVSDVNPTGQRDFATEVSDAQGAFVLHQTLTQAGSEPGAPGQVTIQGGSTATAWGPFPTTTGLEQTAAASQASEPAPVLTRRETESEVVQNNWPALPFELAASLVEQVFGELGQTPVADEIAYGQGMAILNPDVSGQSTHDLLPIDAGSLFNRGIEGVGPRLLGLGEGEGVGVGDSADGL